MTRLKGVGDMIKLLSPKIVRIVTASFLAWTMLLLSLLFLNRPDAVYATPPIEENPISTGNPIEIISTVDSARALAAADLDRNGRPDLVLADDNRVRIIANTGDTTPHTAVLSLAKR